METRVQVTVQKLDESERAALRRVADGRGTPDDLRTVAKCVLTLAANVDGINHILEGFAKAGPIHVG